MGRAVGALVFGGIFGILFIVMGVRRLASLRSGDRKLDSLLWGTVGICLGFGFLFGAFWLMTPPADDIQELRVRVRMPLAP